MKTDPIIVLGSLVAAVALFGFLMVISAMAGDPIARALLGATGAAL